MKKLSLLLICSLLCFYGCFIEDKSNDYRPLRFFPDTCIAKNFRVLPEGENLDLIIEKPNREYVLGGKNFVVLDSVGNQVQSKNLEFDITATIASPTGGYWLVTSGKILVKIDENFTEEFQVALDYPDVKIFTTQLINTSDGGVIILFFQQYSSIGLVEKRDNKGVLQWQNRTFLYYDDNTKIIPLTNKNSYLLLHPTQNRTDYFLTELNDNGININQFSAPLAWGTINDINPTQDEGFILATSLYIIKLTNALEVEWSKQNSCSCTTIKQLADRSFIAASGAGGVITLHKVDRQGITIWEKIIEKLIQPELISIYSTQDGGALLLLSVNDEYDGTETVRYVFSIGSSYVIKIDSNGNFCE